MTFHIHPMHCLDWYERCRNDGTKKWCFLLRQGDLYIHPSFHQYDFSYSSNAIKCILTLIKFIRNKNLIVWIDMRYVGMMELKKFFLLRQGDSYIHPSSHQYDFSYSSNSIKCIPIMIKLIRNNNLICWIDMRDVGMMELKKDVFY